jgi:poly(3-hydroxybutyrate) depolymerase
MNLSTHTKKHVNFFKHLVAGDDNAADRHRHFYDEYMAVLDMTESFYLETLESVFMHHHLPQGKVNYQGESVDLGAITDTALYTVEGGQDDICAVGQTKAAHALCTQLTSDKQQYDLYPEVGHYGIFSGSKFRNEIAPKIGTFIAKHH